MRNLKQHRAAAVLIALAALLIAGCGVRSGVSWPDATVYTDEEGDKTIVVAFNDFIERVDLNGNNVFLVDEDGNVRVDVEGRRREWSVSADDVEGSTGFYVSPIRLDEDTILIPEYNDRLLIFEATEAYVRQEASTTSEVSVKGKIVAQPALYEPEEGARLLLVPFREEDVVAYDIDDNFSVQWTVDTSRGVWVSPLVIDDVAYIPSLDHQLYAVDAATGDLLWQVDVGGAIAGRPYYDGESLYLGTLGRQILRVDPSGSYDDPQDRITAVYNTEGWVWAQPAYSDGVFYIGDMNGFAYALEATPNGFVELWKREVAGAGIRPTPVVTDEHVIVAARDGHVFWLDRETGNEFVRHDIDTEILADMVVIEPAEDTERPGLVIVVTDENDKILVPFTLNGDRYTWVYNR
jgi:outer membrane protein assembly factor BamB